jgi:CRISPR/Cas system-associated exonuclease Cas4 (RecB family)
MDPLTRGALFHEVQRDFFRAFTAGADMRALADRVLNNVAQRYAERLAPAIMRVWDSEIEDIRTDLHGWIHYIAGSTDWQPVHAELAFGLKDLDGRDPASRTEAVTAFGARIAGSIDLVEQHRTSGRLRVIDHKTGKPMDRKPSAVAGGAVLQPLLYAAAAEELLGATVERGELFYCTQRGNYIRYSIEYGPSSTKWAGRAMQIINDAITGGKLRTVPSRNACKLCEFRCNCGPYEERRIRRKIRSEELQPLDELRSMP